MPDISDAEYRTFVRYQNLGAPEEVEKKIRDLEKDNRTQRRTISTLETKIPKDGEIVLPKAEADLLPKYKELGDAEKLAAELKEGREARTELATTIRSTAAEKFAGAAGLASETVGVLLAIPALQEAKFEIRKDKPFIVQKDGTALSFEDAKEKIPELKGLRPATNEVGFIKQGGDRSGGAGSIYDKIRNQRKQEQEAAVKAPAVKSLEERLGIARM
jgi:hypothetical protein